MGVEGFFGGSAMETISVDQKVTNQFYSPIPDVLIKGAEEDGQWIVYLQASNELRDRQGEVIEVGALQKASDHYLRYGVLSWDHMHKIKDDPEYIIGEPLDVRFTENNETLVKGWLYKSNKMAQKVWGNIQSGAKRIGASVGGGVLQKAGSRIAKVIWDETALTSKPINVGTLGNVSLVPFSAFAKSVMIENLYDALQDESVLEIVSKALMAGSGVDAASFTGGRAMIPESLQGSTTNVLPRMGVDDLAGIFSFIVQDVISGNIQSYDDLKGFLRQQGFSDDQSRKVIAYMTKKLPSVASAVK